MTSPRVQYFFFLLFVFLHHAAKTQSVLNGDVKSTSGSPIIGASLKLYKGNNIIGYSLSDVKGNFSLKLKNNSDSLSLEVSHISYVSQRMNVVPMKENYSIVMQPASKSLPEVKIKAPPISKKGDTISYDVRAFTSQQDRVIGDVIRKLPGVEVTETGQIKYNGKAITNYYIEGLDLLESRYNLANQNISLDLVEKVQILENHQAVKILDSNVAANNPALNIKLKANAKSKLYINATVGTGFDTTLLWHATATAMKFSKKRQFLNGLKLNNTSDDYSLELTENLTLDNLDQVQRIESKNDLLFLQKPQLPFIKKSRFVFNNSAIAFLNGLFLLKKNAQLKYSISVLADKQRNDVENVSNYYFFNDTITVFENQALSNDNKMIKTDVKYVLNQPNLYISNKLNYTGYFSKATGDITGSSSVSQQLENPYYRLSNELTLYKKIKKQLFQLNSYISLKSIPQRLNVLPGQFADVFNSGMPFERLGQLETQRDILFSNILSTKTNFLKFQQKVSLRLDYQGSRLTSDLQKKEGGNVSTISETFKNNLWWDKLTTEIRPDFMFYRRSFKITLSTPLSLTKLITSDKISNTNRTRNYTFFVPTLVIFKPINQFLDFNINLASIASIGNITNTARGFVMTNYRIISNNEDNIAVDKSASASMLVSFRNTRKAIFGYVSGLYSQTNRNLINDQLYNQTLLSIKTIPLSNTLRNYQLITNFSKYFPKTKTTFSVNFSYNQLRSFLYNNNLLTPIVNGTFATKYALNTKRFKSFFAEYTGSLIQSKSTFAGVSNTAFQSIHDLNLYVFISKQFTAATYFSYNANRSNQLNQYFFADIGLTYKSSKHEIDCRLNNLTNTKFFIWKDISENATTVVKYRIRPLSLLVRYTFKL
jgi:hypothetical protein